MVKEVKIRVFAKFIHEVVEGRLYNLILNQKDGEGISKNIKGIYNNEITFREEGGYDYIYKFQSTIDISKDFIFVTFIHDYKRDKKKLCDFILKNGNLFTAETDNDKNYSEQEVGE